MWTNVYTTTRIRIEDEGLDGLSPNPRASADYAMTRATFRALLICCKSYRVEYDDFYEALDESLQRPETPSHFAAGSGNGATLRQQCHPGQ